MYAGRHGESDRLLFLLRASHNQVSLRKGFLKVIIHRYVGISHRGVIRLVPNFCVIGVIGIFGDFTCCENGLPNKG